MFAIYEANKYYRTANFVANSIDCCLNRLNSRVNSLNIYIEATSIAGRRTRLHAGRVNYPLIIYKISQKAKHGGNVIKIRLQPADDSAINSTKISA